MPIITYGSSPHDGEIQRACHHARTLGIINNIPAAIYQKTFHIPRDAHRIAEAKCVEATIRREAQRRFDVPLDAAWDVIADALEKAIERRAGEREDTGGEGKVSGDEPARHSPDRSKAPGDLITTGVAIKRFYVSRATLIRALQNGKLHTYRPEGAPRNAPHLYSEAALASYYVRRDAVER